MDTTLELDTTLDLLEELRELLLELDRDDDRELRLELELDKLLLDWLDTKELTENDDTELLEALDMLDELDETLDATELGKLGLEPPGPDASSPPLPQANRVEHSSTNAETEISFIEGWKLRIENTRTGKNLLRVCQAKSLARFGSGNTALKPKYARW